MHRLEVMVSMLDRAFGTKRKKHIAGGILFSASLLFASLALTIITLKTEENEDAQYIE